MTDWNEGPGLQNAADPLNPFGQDYDVVTVPYCTGDVYSGSRTADYGGLKPHVMRHHGYENVTRVLAEVKQHYPKPEKAVLFGCSAGGIGAYYHLRGFAEAFPDSRRYVVSDAGTPFKPPYLRAAKYEMVMSNWGADATLPEGVRDFGALIRYNTEHYPDIRFGLIDSYKDKVMGFFAMTVGSPTPFVAVERSLNDAADGMEGSANARVFYTQGNRHCHSPEPLGQVTSEGESLGQWLGDLIGDSSDWKSHRP
jgi:hypothetical protein